MSEHYTTNTKLVSTYCPTCNRNTMHRVDFKRLGSCTEHSAEGYSRSQVKRMQEMAEKVQQPELF